MNRNRKIKVFYTPKQVCIDNIKEKLYSKSPLKPMLLMEYLEKNVFNFKNQSAKATIEDVFELTGRSINIHPKNKKLVIRKAYKILTEESYV